MMISRRRIPPGTLVSWTSQSRGYESEKSGTVVAFVPAGKDIRDIYPPLVQVARSRVKGGWVGLVDRYLVEVFAGQRANYYTPFAWLLEK